MATSVPRTMPKHLKATYLADQESLLVETRATTLYYFPGTVLWLLVFGLLAWFTAAVAYGWPGQISAYDHALSTLAGVIHFSTGTFETYLLYVLLFLVVVGLVRLLVQYLRWISKVYAVTSRRVIVQKGILGRDFDEIPVLQVRGVDVHQTAGQRLLGYGTVKVSSEEGNWIGNENWYGIPRPLRIQKLIEDATANLEPAGAVPGTTAPGHR